MASGRSNASHRRREQLIRDGFFVREGDGYRLRWFTPVVEVDLCGHATLATAFIILNQLTPSANSVRFQTKSGTLVVNREGDLFSMDFPSRPPAESDAHPKLIEALGGTPEIVLAARDYLVVYASEDEVRKLEPNMQLLSEVDKFAVIVTAPGKDVDFVSRFFAPAKGVPEDPVTGSAHCTLNPVLVEAFGEEEAACLSGFEARR